jgi:thiopurine S-methyltransferase
VLAAGALKLLCGDIFALPGDGAFDRVWDRASLVALDPVQRQRYAACITAAMAPRGVMLLQVLHRQAGAPLALQGGPPFSVTEADVKALYGRRVPHCLARTGRVGLH